MNLARILLGINAVFFIGYGILNLIWPAAMAAQVDLWLTPESSLIELRAAFGGAMLGVGVFFAWTLTQPGHTVAGLIAMIAIIGGFAVGRAAGMLTETPVASIHGWLLGIEVVLVAAGVVALRRVAAPR